jgi:hypothetical protein
LSKKKRREIGEDEWDADARTEEDTPFEEIYEEWAEGVGEIGDGLDDMLEEPRRKKNEPRV